MKKIFWIAGIISTVATISCSDVRREPGRVYVPDMAYSRAFETYAALDTNKFTTDPSQAGEGKIFYNSKPVLGTIARGDETVPFSLTMDKPGDSVNYNASKSIANPITSLSAKDSIEAERLYLVNCGICHGMKLDGNGPLYNGGNGAYLAKPATLVGDAKYEAMPEGQMFYSVTYGKNAMGSYASQLTEKQRWMVIHYVKSKQNGGKTAAAATTTTAPAAKDSAAAKTGK